MVFRLLASGLVESIFGEASRLGFPGSNIPNKAEFNYWVTSAETVARLGEVVS